MKFVKAEEAVGEDDGVERGSCSGLDWRGWGRIFRRGHTRYLARILA